VAYDGQDFKWLVNEQIGQLGVVANEVIQIDSELVLPSVSIGDELFPVDE